MKKLLAIISLLIYFTVSTGFVVSVHYCMDELDDVAWGEVDSDKCGKCGMPASDNNGCCKDEVKVVKLKVDQTTAKLVKTVFSAPIVSPVSIQYLISAPATDILIEEPVAHGPPLSEQDTYLQNRVFRI